MSEILSREDMEEWIGELESIEHPDLRGHAIIRLYRDIVGMPPGEGKNVDPAKSMINTGNRVLSLETIRELKGLLIQAKKDLQTLRPVLSQPARDEALRGFDEYIEDMETYEVLLPGEQKIGTLQNKNRNRAEYILNLSQNTWNAQADLFQDKKKKKSGRTIPPQESAA